MVPSHLCRKITWCCSSLACSHASLSAHSCALQLSFVCKQHNSLQRPDTCVYNHPVSWNRCRWVFLIFLHSVYRSVMSYFSFIHFISVTNMKVWGAYCTYFIIHVYALTLLRSRLCAHTSVQLVQIQYRSSTMFMYMCKGTLHSHYMCIDCIWTCTHAHTKLTALW